MDRMNTIDKRRANDLWNEWSLKIPELNARRTVIMQQSCIALGPERLTLPIGLAIINLNTKFQAVFRATNNLLSDQEYIPLGDEATHSIKVLGHTLDQQEDKLQKLEIVQSVRRSLFKID